MTKAELDAIADSLNNRPRATHAFHSPLEVFAAGLCPRSSYKATVRTLFKAVQILVTGSGEMPWACWHESITNTQACCRRPKTDHLNLGVPTQN